MEIRGTRQFSAIKPPIEQGHGEFVEIREGEDGIGGFWYFWGGGGDTTQRGAMRAGCAEELAEVGAAGGEEVGEDFEGFAGVAGEEGGHACVCDEGAVRGVSTVG